MAGKPVDLGPMAMPVGDDTSGLNNILPACQSDVLRLNQLLADDGHHQNGNDVFDADKTDVDLTLPPEFASA